MHPRPEPGSAGPGLDPALVDQAGGAQPFRRLFHAVNGVAVVTVLEVLDLPTRTAVTALIAVFLGLLLLDVVRLRIPAANDLFFRAFARLVSPREATGVASSTWYALGLILALALFPRAYALTGILVLALADPAASYVGRRWGRRPFLGASMEGTVVFAATALAVLWFRHPPGVALVTAPLTALAERFSWPLDDNLTLPVATAAILTLLEVLG